MCFALRVVSRLHQRAKNSAWTRAASGPLAMGSTNSKIALVTRSSSRNTLRNLPVVKGREWNSANLLLLLLQILTLTTLTLLEYGVFGPFFPRFTLLKEGQITVIVTC